MIPVTQSRTGKDGNCLSACLASILEVPLAAVPDFYGDEWLEQVNEWLGELGYRYELVPSGGVRPVGYSTVEGISPRGGVHACVGYNGVIVHDPHPQDGTGRGLRVVQRYGVLRRVAQDERKKKEPWWAGLNVPLEELKLENKILRAFPSSPRQKELQAQLDAMRKKRLEQEKQ